MAASSSSESPSQRWWISVSGEADGPYSHAYLVARLSAGQLDHETLLIPEGGRHWKPLFEWPAFKSGCNYNAQKLAASAPEATVGAADTSEWDCQIEDRVVERSSAQQRVNGYLSVPNRRKALFTLTGVTAALLFCFAASVGIGLRQSEQNRGKKPERAAAGETRNGVNRKDEDAAGDKHVRDFTQDRAVFEAQLDRAISGDSIPISKFPGAAANTRINGVRDGVQRAFAVHEGTRGWTFTLGLSTVRDSSNPFIRSQSTTQEAIAKFYRFYVDKNEEEAKKDLVARDFESFRGRLAMIYVLCRLNSDVFDYEEPQLRELSAACRLDWKSTVQVYRAGKQLAAAANGEALEALMKLAETEGIPLTE